MTDTPTTIRYQDQHGALLWEEPMIFKRLFARGDELCEARQWYKVKAVNVDGAFQNVTLARIP